MNNYSFLEKILHRLVLSSKSIKNYTYELELALFKKHLINHEDNHVFVAGLARSGTTILMNMIFKSKQFASLTYEDMPFLMAPNFWNKIQPNSKHESLKERAHNDGILISTNSPEAFEEVFWRSFKADISEKQFKEYIHLILNKNKKHRYVSKNNQNVKRLKIIRKIFPNSLVLIPFRSPLQQSNSLIKQHKKFIEMQQEDGFVKDYMNWIFHTEFGLTYKPIISDSLEYKDTHSINHWLEQWLKVYSKLYEELSEDENIIFICYEELCLNKKYWEKIKEKLKISHLYEAEFSISNSKVEYEFDNELKDSCDRFYEELLHKVV